MNNRIDCGTTNQSCYLIGLAVCDMSGVGECKTRAPYLLIHTADRQRAEDEYSNRVPLSSYYPGNTLAVCDKDGRWQMLDDGISVTELQEILSGNEIETINV